ncbi:MAG: hypothetical protein ACRDLN_01025 [Solirubrobacteraceae bacterium]
MSHWTDLLRVLGRHDAMFDERRLADALGLLDPGALNAETGDPLGGREDAAVPYVPAAEARCWLWLRPGAANEMFEDVPRLLPHDRMRSRAIQQVRLAQGCAAAGESARAASEDIREALAAL